MDSTVLKAMAAFIYVAIIKDFCVCSCTYLVFKHNGSDLNCVDDSKGGYSPSKINIKRKRNIIQIA